MAVTYNGFNLDDGVNYIITEIEGDRGMPQRDVRTEPLSRREGVRFLGDDFKQKGITLHGMVFADTIAAFETALDNLKKRLEPTQGELQTQNNRSYSVTLTSFEASESSESLTATNFTAEFIANEPFAKGGLLTVSIPVTSGITTVSGFVTISGTAFMRPIISFTVPTGSGLTNVQSVAVNHLNSGEIVTWSGTSYSPKLERGDIVSFNYINLTVLRNSTQQDYEGIFSKWQPGDNAFAVSFVNAPPGGNISFSYQPRYL